MKFGYEAARRMVHVALRRMNFRVGSEIEDIVQEVMLRHFEHPTRPIKYIIIDYLRANFRSKNGYDTTYIRSDDHRILDSPQHGPDIMDTYSAKEVSSLARSIVTDPFKKVVLHLYLQGLDQREIASRLGYTEAHISQTMKALIRRFQSVMLRNY